MHPYSMELVAANAVKVVVLELISGAWCCAHEITSLMKGHHERVTS